MANDYSTICENLATVAAVAAFPQLAAFKSISTVAEMDDPAEKARFNPAFPRQMPLIKSISATQTTNSPNYYDGDCVVEPRTFQHVLYTQPFHISSWDLNSGARLEWMAGIAGQQIAQKISDALTGLLTVANFGDPVVTSDASAFGVAEFETLYGAVKTPERVICLDTPYFAKVKSTWLPVGFNRVVEHARWAPAGTKINGFAGDPRALLISYGAPNIASPGRQVVAEKRFLLPQIGIAGASTLYFSTNDRRLFGCYSVYVGATVGTADALKLLARSSD